MAKKLEDIQQERAEQEKQEQAEQKKKAIKKEANKIKRLLSQYDEELPKNNEALINNIAWQSASLDLIKQEVERYGYIEVYNNGGGQSGTKDSSALRAYNNLAKTYLASVKTLNDIIKPYLIQSSGADQDILLDFLNNNNK